MLVRPFPGNGSGIVPVLWSKKANWDAKDLQGLCTNIFCVCAVQIVTAGAKTKTNPCTLQEQFLFTLNYLLISHITEIWRYYWSSVKVQSVLNDKSVIYAAWQHRLAVAKQLNNSWCTQQPNQELCTHELSLWYKQKKILFKIEWIFLTRFPLVSKSWKDLQSIAVSEGASYVRPKKYSWRASVSQFRSSFFQALEERHYCIEWSALWWSQPSHRRSMWFKQKAFAACLIVRWHESNTFVGFTVHQKWETEVGKMDYYLLLCFPGKGFNIGQEQYLITFPKCLFWSCLSKLSVNSSCKFWMLQRSCAGGRIKPLWGFGGCHLTALGSVTVNPSF